MSKAAARRHQLTISSSQKNLKKVANFIEDLAAEMGFHDDAVVDIAISTTEAVNNAIIHGNKKDQKKKVKILVDLGAEQITVRVRDQGAGFCPENVCSPLEPENLTKCNGRGIFILRSLMDQVTYRAAPGGGTEVEMIKRLQSTESARSK